MENNDYIVINKQELNTDYVKNRIIEEKESKRDLNQAERIPVQNNILLNPTFYTSACGFFAAFLGWIITEPLVAMDHRFLILLSVTMIMFLCASISSIDSFLSGNFLKGLKTGLIGLLLGLLWGVAGTIICGLVVGCIRDICSIVIRPDLKADGETIDITLKSVIYCMLGRAPGWAVLGLGVGIIPGISNYSMKIGLNGAIGGMLGGFIGGFIFDPIAFSMGNTSAALSRCIGFGALSILVGFFVGLVENMAKEVWITMKSGPLRGKQFVIYHNPTLIGSSPRSDIYIFKDPNVMPTHAKIQKRGSKYEIIDDSNGIGVYVNSEKINGSKVLEHKDEIILGQSVLEFQQKERG